MKPQAKPTPGPWEVGTVSGAECAVQTTTYPKRIIAILDDSIVGHRNPENARLIAAAPELLEALVAMRELYQWANNRSAFASMGGDRYIAPGKMDKALCKALGIDYMSASESELRTAIVKATGGAE